MGLGELLRHKLCHTIDKRLHETDVAESTISDILRHSSTTMTQHYNLAEIVELHQALEKTKDDAGRWKRA